MAHTAAGIRPPAVAGAFYAANALGLAQQVDALLAHASNPHLRPKALIVPHAGYLYSGPIAASAYAAVAAMQPKPTKVVLLGPSHHVGFQGLALPGVDALSTPLGLIELDPELVNAVRRFPFVGESPLAHKREHSLEVQLPFLQRALGKFTVLPLLVGHARPAEVAAVLDAVWGGDETLIVVSSDLSHDLTFEEARTADAYTARCIGSLDGESLAPEGACGAEPVRGLLVAAREHRLSACVLDLRNSGETAGDRLRVVGYGAFAFTRVMSAGVPDGGLLLAIARGTLAEAFGAPQVTRPAGQSWLDELRAVFVTLKIGDELRGCVGQLAARLRLFEAVREAATSAAFCDTRFLPVREVELAVIRLEVSVLSPLEPMEVRDEAELLEKLRPGVDGLVLCHQHRSALFIPEMWKQLPDKREFLSYLKRKAGLPQAWVPGTKVERFTAQHWQE